MSTSPEMWDEIDYVVPTGQAKKACRIMRATVASDGRESRSRGRDRRRPVRPGGRAPDSRTAPDVAPAGRADRPGSQGAAGGRDLHGSVRRLHASKGGPTRSSPTSRGGSTCASGWGSRDQLIETDASHRRSFVVKNGRLVPVPEGFVLMAPHRLMPILTTPDPLVAGQAPVLDGPGHPAPRRRRRGEPGGLRAPPAGPRGPRPPGSAAGRGHLHGRPQRPEPEGDLAPVPGDGARPSAA